MKAETPDFEVIVGRLEKLAVRAMRSLFEKRKGSVTLLHRVLLP
jgi:hypothetical protein